MRKEFEQFMSSEEANPPPELNDQVLQMIRRELRVNKPWLVLKLFLIHCLVGAATLSFCPQFNLGPVGKGLTPTLYALMQIHPLLCAVFCGTVFLGSSALVSVLALRSSELVLVKRQAWWIYSLLAAASLGFFMLAGSVLHGHHDISFALVWVFAAIVSASVILKSGAALRTRFSLRVSAPW